MIKELQKYSDLGTPSFLFEFINSVEQIKKKEWTLLDFQRLLRTKNIDGIRDITGCVYLLIHIGVLKKTENGLFFLSDEIIKQKADRKKLNKRFISLLFDSLKEDDVFFEIFSDEHISFDPFSKFAFIKNSAFGFKYSRLREILKAFD